jgi:ATP-dependent DNA helicase DinG
VKRQDRIREVEAALGRVVADLPGGEVRDGQLQMAIAVSDALAGDGAAHVAIAAGTGTGKSLGYLVPAVLSGKRVVVATATLALQDQLATKDLPLLEETIGRRFAWAVLKGRSNYLCRQRLREIEQAGRQEALDLDLGGSASRALRRMAGGRAPGRAETVGEQVARLVAWAARTESGDRSGLDFEPLPAAWGSVSVSAEECPGAVRCYSGGECFAEKARSQAAAAEIVVVNHHLLGAHLRSGGVVLAEHDALVVDEAHELEDILASSLGAEVGPGRLRALASMARPALGDRGPSGAGAVEDLLEAAARFEAALADSPESRLPPGLGSLGPLVGLLATRLERLERELRAATSPDRSGEELDGGSPLRPQAGVRALLAVERCREELAACLAAGADEVVWVSGGERRSLRSAPLDVSGRLHAAVFSKMPVVLTSATLPPGLAIRLGATAGEVAELDVGSPFDYEHHGLLYCATGLPDRRRPGAAAALHDELVELVLAAGGRTLALFTSRQAMEAAAAAVRARVGWPVHVQGDLPKPALVAAFAREPEACLFATMGYWQGVDVPGATLSLVVIDKIPFPRPDEPLTAARREAAGSEGFRRVDLPRAATLLAQGAGRLIRTATDRGVVAVLDPRLATASYSGYLVRALPTMRRTRERAEAVAFLAGIREEADLATRSPGPATAPGSSGGRLAAGGRRRARASTRGAGRPRGNGAPG